MSSEIKKTALNKFHKAHGGRMVDFAGWEMPVQYSSIIAEHHAVRKQAGLFDVSHMGEILVEGPEAAAFLDFISTNIISTATIGKAVYSILCTEEGYCVDDIIVYRMGETRFLVVLNASNVDKDFAWFQKHISTFDCSVQNVSAMYAQLAIQGPLAASILDVMNFDAYQPSTLTRFTARDCKLNGKPVILARTGYTGEDGFEIYCQTADSESLAESILEAGQESGLQLCGLGARDSLRLEAGYPLYGHEISESINPIEAGLGWVVKFKKADFLGKSALQKSKIEGPEQHVIHFILNDKRIARAGIPVYAGETQIGEVLSGTQSPILNKPIGSALIRAKEFAASKLSVEIRKKRYSLNLKKPPLHL